MNKILLLFVLSFLPIQPVWACAWQVDPNNSSIKFSGTHADRPFTGAFKSWTADIFFNTSDLNSANIRVNIDTGSATTGDKTYDASLPQGEWFNAKAFPQASFISTQVVKSGDAGYIITGDLKIKDIQKTIDFPFTLNLSENNTQAKVIAELNLDRLLYGIGAVSDPKAEWVSKDIKVSIDLSADCKTQ